MIPILSRIANIHRSMLRFLWAKLEAANICDMVYERDVRDALRSLKVPQKMSETYMKYAGEFESLNSRPTEQQIALRTMALLGQTTGSMRKETLLVALAINLEDGELDTNTYNQLRGDPSTLVRTCKYLIEINEELGIFRFCHMSAFEFFRWYQPGIDHGRIAQLCLAHLCSSDISEGPHNDAKWYGYGSLEPFLQMHPFLEFASCNWAVSLRKSLGSDTEVNVKQTYDSVSGLLEILLGSARGETKKNLELSFQVYLLSLGRSMPSGVCHEHILSYFALPYFLDIFDDKGLLDMGSRDNDGSTALHWALRSEPTHNSRKNDVALFVEELISKYKCDKNGQDNKGRTPLYYASQYGNEQAVSALLKAGVDPNIKTKRHETPLIVACKGHHEDIVCQLINAGADVRAQGFAGTALQMVSLSGCVYCANLILDKYGEAPIAEADGPFGTPLHTAAFHGHLELVKLLCDRNINVWATNETYGTALTAAAAGCNPGMDGIPFYEIFQKLIDRGVSVNDPSGQYGPALRAAAFNGHSDLVQLLLKAGGKVSLANGLMGTAYEAASERGHQIITDILLASDPNAATYRSGDSTNGFTTISSRAHQSLFNGALRTGSPIFVNSLLDRYEKSIENEVKKGMTPILQRTVDLGKEGFHEAIRLATTTNTKAERKKSRLPTEHTIVEEQREDSPNSNGVGLESKGYRKFFRRIAYSLRCGEPPMDDTVGPSHQILVPPVSTENKVEPTISRSQRIPILTQSPTNFRLRRVSSSAIRASLEGYYPEVLERFAKLAVRVLEVAINGKDAQVIKLIAGTWVEAMNTVISCFDFGEFMLERMVQDRAIELKEHLAYPQLDFEARLKKMEDVACVAVELLLAAARRGPTFQRLSSILSRLFVSVSNGVEDRGKRGQTPEWSLIHLFTRKISATFASKDRINGEICIHAIFEFLKQVAMSRKKRFMDKCCEEWARQWNYVIETQMDGLLNELITRRWEEYQKHIIDKRYDEALGLAIAVIGFLRAAIKQRLAKVVQTLLPIIEEGFGWTIEKIKISMEQAPGSDLDPQEEETGLNIGKIFDNLIYLFSTAERAGSGCLRTFAILVLDNIEALPSDDQQAIKVLAHQRIQAARKRDDPELELHLKRTCVTANYLLELARRFDRENRPKTLSMLEDVVQALPRLETPSVLSLPLSPV